MMHDLRQAIGRGYTSWPPLSRGRLQNLATVLSMVPSHLSCGIVYSRDPDGFANAPGHHFGASMAKDVIEVFRACGLTSPYKEVNWWEISFGVTLLTPIDPLPSVTVLLRALKEAGLEFEHQHDIQSGFTRFDDRMDVAAILQIGVLPKFDPEKDF
jgi:hypothetical protein